MNRPIGILIAAMLMISANSSTRGDEATTTAILDKAIAALGGEAKLTKAASGSWTGSGTITFNETVPIKTKTTVDGIDRQRSEFEVEFNGTTVKGVTVLNGTKGWRKFNDETQDLEGEMLAGALQAAYLQAISSTILPMKTKAFKVETGEEAKVGDRPAAVVRGTGPDGKSFTLYFDKETGLPLKVTATTRGFQGEDVKQETTFADYKEFDGLKRATKIAISRDGNPFSKMEYADFKLIEKHDSDTFAEPK